MKNIKKINKKLIKQLNKVISKDFKVDNDHGLNLVLKRRESLGFDHGVIDYSLEFRALLERQPIFKLNNKFMYEGDEYWLVNKKDNWRLRKAEVVSICDIIEEGYRYKRFATKQEALNYVLEEARERFEGKKMDWAGTKRDIGLLEIKKYDEYYEISDNHIMFWNSEEGFNDNIKVLKQPKLMLGNEVVEIIPIAEAVRNGELNQDVEVHCKGESVTKEEWIELHEKIKHSINFNIDYFECQWAGYNVLFSRYKTTIGCIKEITLEQIEEITKALNEL